MADYKKPVLLEIYSETFFRGGDLPAERFFEIVPILKGLGFPHVEFAQVGVFQFNPNQSTIAPAQTPRIRCWNEDKSRLVQIGQDLLVINLIGPYSGWKNYFALFKDVHLAVGRGNQLHPESIALHTIDKFTVKPENFRLDEYLAVGGEVIPGWYSGTREAADITLGRGFLQTDGLNQTVNVSVRVGEGISFEFRISYHRRLKEREILDEVLNALHKETTATFEAIISDRVRTEIMGGLENAH